MDELFFHRMDDLARKSFRDGRVLFSDFLSESECARLRAEKARFSFCPPELFGGAENCVRCVAKFGNAYEAAFPIACVCITPKNKKYVSHFSHRDFLGAILSLGLERSVIGDVVIFDDVGYCYCLAHIAPYLEEHLTSIGKTAVVCKRTEEHPSPVRNYREESTTVSSLRCDCIVCAVFHFSRAEALELFRNEKITLNGLPCSENAKELKEGDCVAVRGKGKLIVSAVGALTKKERIRLCYKLPE